jgi:phasin
MAENAAREFTQKATSYTADALDKTKTTAEETSKVMEHSYVTASKGAVDFNLKLIEVAQDNINAAFDFARQLAQIKSPAEFLELSTSYARNQMEKLASQSQHLTGVAQKGMTETAQSLQAGVAKIGKRT